MSRRGVSYRLWTEREHGARRAFDDPEVASADLAGALLTATLLGEADLSRLPWRDAPPRPALDRAEQLLTHLGALDDGQLTQTGQQMAQIPAHPRVARALIEAHRIGCLRSASEQLAILDEGGGWVRTGGRAPTENDLADRWYAAMNRGGRGWAPIPRALQQRLKRRAEQLHETARRVLGRSPSQGGEAVRALCAGWPDRVSGRRDDGRRYHMASGRGAELHRESGLRGADLLLALDVTDQPGALALVRLGARVDPAWIHSEARIEVRYDAEQDKLFARRAWRTGALLLREQRGVRAPKHLSREALAAAMRTHPHRAVPLKDKDFARFLARVAFAERAATDVQFPSTDLDTLVEYGVERLSEERSLAAVQQMNWIRVLGDRLDYAQRKVLDERFPDNIRLGNGVTLRVDYPTEGPAVIAARIQRFFGLRQTPRIDGRAVMLHLLAPNGRPEQITDDLAGFWERGWPEVRKLLRGRYPKHAWPEDPHQRS